MEEITTFVRLVTYGNFIQHVSASSDHHHVCLNIRNTRWEYDYKHHVYRLE